MRIWTLVMTMLLSGCGVVNKSVHTSEFKTTPVAEADVHVYLAGDTIPEACVPVADLKAFADTKSHLWEIISRLRAEAGALGANAIHLQTMERPGFGDEMGQVLANVLTLGLAADAAAAEAGAVALHCPNR